jgi:TonB family protein
MGDIIPDYPSSWIKSYISVEISSTFEGKTVVAKGVNDTLSSEQISMLKTASLGTDLMISIRYSYLNSFTNKIAESQMKYSTTVVPEVQAEFPEGKEQLSQYIRENAINRISDKDSKEIDLAVVSFTVDPNGRIADAHITKTSGDPKVDKLLLKTVNDMPSWKPAENANGIKVGQQFELAVGNTGC